jgi:septal ring factor EnvC (AmiA/AmiB activator)
VEAVNPHLVVRDKEGKVNTVRYDAVNAMLLNEFLKEHCKVGELKSAQEKQQARIAQQRKDFEATIARLQARVVQQQKGMEALVACFREQESKIQKVSDQLELGKAVTNVVLNNR